MVPASSQAWKGIVLTLKQMAPVAMFGVNRSTYDAESEALTLPRSGRIVFLNYNERLPKAILVFNLSFMVDPQLKLIHRPNESTRLN